MQVTLPTEVPFGVTVIVLVVLVPVQPGGIVHAYVNGPGPGAFTVYTIGAVLPEEIQVGPAVNTGTGFTNTTKDIMPVGQAVLLAVSVYCPPNAVPGTVTVITEACALLGVKDHPVGMVHVVLFNWAKAGKLTVKVPPGFKQVGDAGTVVSTNGATKLRPTGYSNTMVAGQAPTVLVTVSTNLPGLLFILLTVTVWF